MSGWQDIATAPKDRRVLLYRPTAYEYFRVMGGKYDDDRFSRKPRPYWDSDNWRQSKTELRAHAPTHWQPLPDPPTP